MALNEKKPIVVVDSGAGGLSYLPDLKKMLPDEFFIYVADTKNFPYGQKPCSERYEILSNLLLGIKAKFNPKAIVLACNTASLTLDAALIAKLDLPIIGTKPPLDRAVSLSKSNRIGLLATRETIRSDYIVDKTKSYQGEMKIVTLPAPQLVEFVEKSFIGSTLEERLVVLFPIISFFLMEKIDILILGCTHFLFVKDDLQELIPYMQIIDTVETVSRQLKATLTELNLLNTSTEPAQDLLFLTAKDHATKKQYRALAPYIKFENINFLEDF